MIIIVSIIVFIFGWLIGLITGYSTLKWSLRQDGYYLAYDSTKEIGQGRYWILQEVDLDFGSEDE